VCGRAWGDDDDVILYLRGMYDNNRQFIQRCVAELGVMMMMLLYLRGMYDNNRQKSDA
jgi:hypothetical protein